MHSYFELEQDVKHRQLETKTIIQKRGKSLTDLIKQYMFPSKKDAICRTAALSVKKYYKQCVILGSSMKIQKEVSWKMFDKTARISKALSDPTRLQILDLIRAGYDVLHTSSPVQDCEEGICVLDIQSAFDLAQSKVSYHLKELKQAELIYETKRGKWNFYTINKKLLYDYQLAIQDRFLHNES